MFTLTGAKDNPDATEDSGASFPSGNALPYDREQALSDIPSMPALGPGAGLGERPGRIAKTTTVAQHQRWNWPKSRKGSAGL